MITLASRGQVMVEKRVAPRHRVLKAGTIEFGGGAIDCAVRNVSKTGAAFEVASPVGIPEKLTLVIPGDGLNFSCRVIWRLGLSVGVKFD
jgi:hypothetical protein